MKNKNDVTEMVNLMREAGYEWPFIVGVMESIIKTNLYYNTSMEPSIEYWTDRATDEISKKVLKVSV